jgi:hypothetical protein
MATIPDTSDDDVRRLNRDAAKLGAETRTLLAEAEKLRAEKYKLSAGAEILSRALIFQAMTALAAIIGAGAVIGKLFFP